MDNNIRHLNIWETTLNEKCQYINTIDDFLSFLESNNDYDFIVSEYHHPTEKPKSILDNIATKSNVHLTYTDNNHNVTVWTPSPNRKTIIVNPTFFENHKNEISNYIKNKINEHFQTKIFFITIPDFLISTQLINELLHHNQISDITIYISNITNQPLTEEQINLFKANQLEVRHNGNLISTNKLINNYTLKDLNKNNPLRIKYPLSNQEIENFIHIKDDTIINIPNKSLTSFNEQDYLSNLQKICNILKTHHKKYNLKININNRELLKQSAILDTPNINFTIENESYEYQQDEYLQEEEQLDKLIEPIKNANLSPYEKYLAVYNIVKNFKPYKENKNNKYESRYLRYILNNEYIVCVGFANLLTTLLNKINIPAMNIGVGIDTSYDSGFTLEDKPTEIAGHQRNIIKIDDEKYNIHGIFLADATWDNSMKQDIYKNSNMTFDQKKEAKRLETLTDYDLLLDFHNFEEFKEKLNFYLKKDIRENPFTKKSYQEKLITAYQNTYKKIMEILSNLDYPKFTEFYNKYQEITNYDITLKEIEEISSKFLTEYATYILPLTNKKISKATLFEAAVNTRIALNKNLNKEETKKQIVEQNDKLENTVFPYHYDPNASIDHYFEAKKR